jgi:N-acetylmuramoyl-L-alanine amidase
MMVSFGLCYGMSADQIAFQLSTRYTPYADGASVMDVDLLSKQVAEAWWTTPETMRKNRTPTDRPLTGLHLALDPGHIGGAWAEWEGRHFRISEEDFWVREGELVLEVAQQIRARLISLGAEVTLLRESLQPINPKGFDYYLKRAAAEITLPTEVSLQEQLEHVQAVRNRALRLAIIIGELAERARVVNQVIRPDALISLHINAAPWPKGPTLQLVDSDHAHVLIFGCLSEDELASPRQQAQLARKLMNGSPAIEARLGAALGTALAKATGLPPSDYNGRNAIRINTEVPHLWARNLMLLRLVDCPTVLMEPYIANGRTSYARIQKALRARKYNQPLEKNDILIEYTDAVVAGVLRVYGRVPF